MQSLTAPPRDGLTSSQVLSIIQSSSAYTVQRGMEVLDLVTRQVVADISDSFEAGTVSRDCTALVHGTATFTVAIDVLYGSQLLRPYMLVTGNGLTARFNCGVFVGCKPKSTLGASVVPSNAITGSDLLAILARQVGDAYAVTLGNTYRQEILLVLALAGVDPKWCVFSGDDIDKTIPGGQPPWPLLGDTTDANTLPTDAAASSGGPTTFLQIINDLLGQINYRGVWADWDGFYRFDPYIAPADRAPEFLFDFDDLFKAIIGNQRTKTRDITATPNQWIFVQSNLTDVDGNPIEPIYGAGKHIVTNVDDGDTSINARGGGTDPFILIRWVGLGVVNSIIQLDAADQATLEALGDKQVAADQAVTTTLDLTTSPFPAAWHEDIYLYSDDEMGAESMKVQSTGWVLDFGTDLDPAADMTHTVVQVA